MSTLTVMMLLFVAGLVIVPILQGASEVFPRFPLLWCIAWILIALFAALVTDASAQQLEEVQLPRGAKMPPVKVKPFSQQLTQQIIGPPVYVAQPLFGEPVSVYTPPSMCVRSDGASCQPSRTLSLEQWGRAFGPAR